MPLCKLTRGFLGFRDHTFLPQRARFEQLARDQQPRVMMIACSDSRVDPAILTNADPGDLFMVRNVANLVPPCQLDQAQHGISAALEYGIKALGVEHVIVFGHSVPASICPCMRYPAARATCAPGFGSAQGLE